MKNFNVINKLTLLLILLGGAFQGFAQLRQCDTCTYTVRLENHEDLLKQIVPMNTITDVNGLYQPCPEGDRSTKQITFIHGLAGSPASWAKQTKWTSEEYFASVDNPTYKGYEQSFFNAGKQLSKNIILADLGKRCPNNDFAIAHSQGGIAARYLDRQWDLQYTHWGKLDSNGTFGHRKFYGLVTFGTPHAGADIAITMDEHTSYVQRVVSTVVMHPLKRVGFNLTDRYGFLFGDNLHDLMEGLDSTIKNVIAPIMITDLHSGTLEEMHPDSITIKDINAHKSRLHKVAFYGVEEDPECWRVFDNIINTASEKYTIFTAVKDDEFMETMNDVRGDHEWMIDAYGSDIDFWSSSWWLKIRNSGKIKRANKAIEHREHALSFLYNANTQWRYLIGSYHVDSVTYTHDTTHYIEFRYSKHGAILNSGTLTFTSQKELNRTVQNFQLRGWNVSKYSKNIASHEHRNFYESDGVVLKRSAIAFPGVRQKHTWRMEGNNHFQERNSPETKKAMLKLYKGGYGDYFITKRKP